MREITRQLADRLLSALRRVEQLYPAALSASGDVPAAPEAPSASQPKEEEYT